MAPRRDRVSCGLDLVAVPDVPAGISSATEAGYQFVFMPIVHPRYRREFVSGRAKDRTTPFTRSDMVLSNADWNTLVVGKLSPHLALDSPCDSVRQQAEAALAEELNFASHLTLPAVTLRLHGGSNANLARHLYSRVVSSCSYQIWVQVPLTSPAAAQRQYRSDLPSEPDSAPEELDDPWLWWDRLRNATGTESRLGVCLQVGADLPDARRLDRWMGEPVKCVMLSADVFISNKKGFPVLTRAHQELMKSLMRLNCQFVVTGANRHQHVKHYWQYLNHLYQVFLEESNDPLSDFAIGYEDYLQCPLQPLMDNLESQTYEIFEKCPVKYSQYQRAMYHAFLDRVPTERKDQDTIVVMVVGAGRGPLVRAAFLAARQAERQLRVYAVEKNPNAVVTLRTAVEEEWGDTVVVVSCDMREWQAPEKADILVSELLGSFGDNELSPECLDGAQKYLKDDGISIPQNYTSFLHPVQSPKLYNDVRSCREKDKPAVSPFEMPYVVYLQNVLRVGQPQPLFHFEHPNRDEVINNSRFKTLTFAADQDCTVHGFGGYFESVLYKDTMISIHPHTHSPGMFSWFPIFFPIREPMEVKQGERVQVSFWRLSNARNVWYEWSVNAPRTLPIHNPNGRSYTIGL
ncbi:protein arginine N-methyltransferase 5-like [Amphibalanus amphitrite]|uniref:protein arginine N-methyltransferase 5-like n=1 Tax=Amphibalanus amphitrite TaxID=1232801 RepID=UPI001C90A081|nr:protein arginine N-methyltransferase 5-like [Amphibalanus amphitrite]XP_043200597.1 protein arginine N-methyltransferase 5-like [Amphibalanus amphitrite]XP_043200598.1 protein arginine N-methyltransferase 5-like [Amphibalanus amphitrite]XP_043200599.1 protein arginine N-methyltransferase 5-like [Amphibalanus amphitrite]